MRDSIRRATQTLAPCALALVLGLVPNSAAQAATQPTIVYDSIPAIVPGNVPSMAFEATSTVEFGDKVRLGAGGRKLDKVTVIMSSWGCEDGHWTGTGGSCLTTPGSTFSHPITINIYEVALGGGPGALLATKTVTQVIPYRPSAFGPPCAGERWSPDGGVSCFNGFATPIEWDFSADAPVTLPSTVIWTVAFNTSHYGSPALGELACFTESGGCGYDSLNVGVETFAGAPYVGGDLDEDGAVLNSSWAGAYCDGGVGGTGTLREDTSPACWAGYLPLAEITTIETSNTVIVKPDATSGWGLLANGAVAITTNNAVGKIVDGPGGQPGGLLSGSVLYETEIVPGGKPQLYAPAAIAGTRFADLTALSYSTLISRYATDPGGNHLTQVLNVKIDLDGNTGTTTDQPILVYEPCYSLDSCVGNVQPLNTWTTWQPLASGQLWWSTATIPGTPFVAFASYVPLDDLYTAHPDATVLWLSVNAGNGSGGAPWNNFLGNVDGITIGASGTSTVYDFEPLPDASPGLMVLGKAVLRPSSRADIPRGSVTLTGILAATDTQSGFETAAVAGSITLRIQDAAGFDTGAIPLTGCSVVGVYRNVKCRSLDRAVIVTFRSHLAPYYNRITTQYGPFLGRYVYSFTATLRNLAQSVTGAATPVGPVQVTLHESPGIDRMDGIGNLPTFPCVPYPRSLRCREK